jgi:hypothetical protein
MAPMQFASSVERLRMHRHSPHTNMASARLQMTVARATVGTACLLMGLWAPDMAAAQPRTPSAAELFKDADLALGEKLIAEHACSACHIRRVGGDGSAIYRPQGRINTPSALRGMVDMCSTELKLSLFPEEVTAVAAVLQRDHYRFGGPASLKKVAP